MSYATILDLRTKLLKNSTLTGYVPSNNIQLGWLREDAEFPTITITQAGGTDVGQLGYNPAPGGSKLAKETVSYQLDLYSKTSVKNILDMYDTLKGIMISSSYEKISDVDMYEPDLKAHRKITIWRKIYYHED